MRGLIPGPLNVVNIGADLGAIAAAIDLLVPLPRVPLVIALGLVYMGCNIPQYGLSFFLPQIVKSFGVSNIAAGFITAEP